MSFLSHLWFETRTDPGLGGVTATPKVFSASAVCGISVEGTIDQFCQLLEMRLDRPVVNETNLSGEFAFHLEPSQTENNDFLDRLRDEVGLVLTPAQRTIETLVFTPR